MAADPALHVVRLPLRRIPQLLRRPLETIEAAARGHDLTRLHVGPRKFYVVNHPDLIREVLEGDQEVFASLRLEPTTTRRLGGESMTLLVGDEHAERRRIVGPIFADSSNERHGGGVVGRVERRAAGWRDGATIDLEAEMTDLTVETITGLVFGGDADDVIGPVKAMYAASREVGTRIVIPISGLFWRLPLPATRRFDRAQAEFNSAVDGLIARRRADAVTGDDLLSGLLHAAGPDGGALTDEQVRDEAWTYVAQGAPAYALTWTWWALARNPEIERAVHVELDRVLGDRAPTTDDLSSLPTLRAAVLETLRLFPTSMGAVRRTRRPVELGGVLIPAGAGLLVSYWTTHRDERFWPDPRKFDLDRWFGDEPSAGRAFVYLAFSAGRNACPARSLALMTAFLTIATLARTWRAHPLADRVAFGVIPFVRPKGGLPARLERRASGSAKGDS